jgi:hypothetical protein
MKLKQLNEGWGAFLGGALAGFFLGPKNTAVIAGIIAADTAYKHILNTIKQQNTVVIRSTNDREYRESKKLVDKLLNSTNYKLKQEKVVNRFTSEWTLSK